METDQIISEDEVTAFRLFRTLSAEKPDILAVDSLQEIASDQHELFSFLQALPPSTRLVQVTGGERKESLAKVASRYNISFNRFDPFAEARTIARVASLGAGAEVIAFENSSEVVVSRHRSPGKGGWSQNRYVRKIHGSVQQRAREIEMELVAAGLRYAKKETRAFGGTSRVSFQVRAPREQVPVSAYRGADVQVRVSGKRLDRIRFRALRVKPQYLIVGIDPGTTTAVAALDLDGNLLHLQSSRQTSMSDVIESLYKVGKPLVIASDVHDMPFSVEKIRRAFNAVPYSPRQDITVETKHQLTEQYEYMNDHERDALAAALDAYRQYRNKFQNVAKRVPPGHDLDEVRAGVIRGQPLEQVLVEMREKALPEVVKPPEPLVAQEQDSRGLALDGIVKRLRVYVGELQEELGKRDREIVRYQVRIRKVTSDRDQRVRRDSEIVKRDAIIFGLKRRLRKEERYTRNLQKRLERMKQIDEILRSGDSVPVKALPAFTREAVRSVDSEIGIRPGDLLFVEKIEGWGRNVVKDLAEKGIGGLITGSSLSESPDDPLTLTFFEFGVPLLSVVSTGALIRGKSGIASLDLINRALSEWEEKRSRYERTRKSMMIEDMFRDYRSERGREIKKYG
jgi:predicted RNase H-like nuclease (RuvC/YqgF family)